MGDHRGKGKAPASGSTSKDASSRTEVIGELPSTVNPEVDSISASLSRVSIQHRAAPLSEIVSQFQDVPLTFAPEDERTPVWLSILPDELVAAVLVQLAKMKDVRSVERFALVCRKARMVSLDVGIWKELVQSTYVPPQIDESVQPLLLYKHYGSDFRQMYINHPRLRLDGVYIAVCHYVRGGFSENAWVAISHLITYHRYLRFLQDGRVLSLLTNEEQPPSQVVHQLKPSLKTKGHYVGTWRLDGTTVIIEDLFDSEGRLMKYGFEMTLELRSKPTGR
ncbi:hypothetical protein FRC02_005179 [Tulasnella sp. 418]|nr:hypothetical protein FRC02_005179 [Tulasnella sp. 418]